MLLGSMPWHEQLVTWTIGGGVVVIAAGMLVCLARLMHGPRLADRAVALDTVAVHLIALVILFSLHLDSLVLFDGILVLSLLGFAGTVAVAQFISRPHLRSRRRGRGAVPETER